MPPFARVLEELEPRRLPLARLELLTVELPLVEPFRSAIGSRRTRRALLVRWDDGDGAFGVGECSCRPDPYFSAEYLEAAGALIADHLASRLSAGMRYGELRRETERIRGWPFAKGALLDAVHDLFRRRGEAGPLEIWRPEGAAGVPAGISLGLPGDAASLAERVRAAAAEGYRRVKLKIRPGLDRSTLAAARDAAPGLALGLDANGSFGEDGIDELARLAELGPAFVEQPFPPERLDLARELKRRAPALTLCLDESVTGVGSLAAAHALGAIDELNLKPGRVGGELAAIAVAERAEALGVPTWVGGMFETGIGRAANLRLAARLPGAAAHDLSPSRRYFAEDLVEDPAAMDASGRVAAPGPPPRLAGERIARCLVERRTLTPEGACSTS